MCYETGHLYVLATYAPLFREYSTTFISPELLAALAQVESAGNPIARTYWRWSLTSDPFAVYQPASSAVGMYQMTAAALSEAQDYCILHHSVVETDCSATLLILGSCGHAHATELAAVFLDRNVAPILGHHRTRGSAVSKGRSCLRSFICAAPVQRWHSRAAASA